MPRTRAAENKRIRQEALREQLANQGHVQHVFELLEQLREDPGELSSLDLQRYKLIIDTKLKLLDKYLPTEKAVEVSGDPDNPVYTQVERTIVNPS